MNQLTETEQAVILEPSGEVARVVIWLHGLGADGHDFLPVVEQLQIGGRDDVRFIFPHAPVIPVSINGGMPMRAWYDILQADLSRRVDAQGILQSVEQVAQLVNAQTGDGLTFSDMVLAGFSQGGVIALHTALQLDLPLAGVMALSTYLPIRQSLQNASHTQQVFLAHGVDDGVVPYSEALSSRQWLQQAGHAVEWHDYPMMHSLCAEEISAIDRFLMRVL